MKTIAIIPARGGSKRIPHKNIINFMGKPMMNFTITAAIKSKIFDRIVVSTDDNKIADVARSNGIEVPFLRNEANDDITMVSDATIAAVKQSMEYWNEEYETVVQLMANCPIRSEKEIISSFTNFKKTKVNSQLSCFKFGFMNPWWSMKINDKYEPEFLHPKALKMRSQDLEDLYCPTGAIWIAKTDDLLKNKSFYMNGQTFFPIDWMSAVDIDDYDDLNFAKAIFNIKKTGSDKQT